MFFGRNQFGKNWVCLSAAGLCKTQGCDWWWVAYEYFIGTLAPYQMPKCKLSKTGATSLTLLSMQSRPAGTLDTHRRALRIRTGSFQRLRSAALLRRHRRTKALLPRNGRALSYWAPLAEQQPVKADNRTGSLSLLRRCRSSGAQRS